jgi:hypothetical protein
MRYLLNLVIAFMAVVLGGLDAQRLMGEDMLMGECPHARTAPRIDPPQTRFPTEWCLDCRSLVDAS